MSKKLKITIVGAGSISFSKSTIGDIVLSDALNDMYEIDLWLMDIVPEHLTDVEDYARTAMNSSDRHGAVTSTTELKPALDGADFVVTAIEVNRYHYWSQDFLIPRKYGFAQIYGENGGPGGTFHTLRNLGPLLEIANTMQEMCPDAWMINYSNPEAKLIQAIATLSKTKAVGMCRGVFMGRDQVSRLLEIPVEEIETTACGLNHFSWLQTIKHKETGEDLYPLLREKEAQAHWLASWDELALNRLLLRTFGLWPYPGTNHAGEYLRWSPQLMACANMNYFYDPAVENPWETDNIPTYIYDLKGNPIDTPLFGSEDVKQIYPKSELRENQKAGEIIPSGEEGILIMEGIACGVERELATVNMPNKGAIPGLPNEMVVEVPAVADDDGLHLKQMNRLPTGITAMLQLQGAIHQLVIEAYTEQSRKKLLQAVLIDPTVSNYHNAVAMINEMCELQKDMLPPLQW